MQQAHGYLLRRILIRLTVFSAILNSNFLHAQKTPTDGIKIKGIIKDDFLQPLGKATVWLVNANGTFASKHVITDSAGHFSFIVSAGNYSVNVSAIGCEAHSTSIFSVKKDNPEMTLPDIQLHTQVKTLKDVSVTATKKAMEASAGKLVLNVDQSAASAGSSALELLQRTPGITVDQNDNLLLKGSASVNVMIDGKMTYLSGQQLSNTLKGMPAENISKIEVITNPSAQYDAAGNTGIINIITKKSNKLGYAANLTAGIGFGRYVLTTENITGNIKTKHFNFFGSFGYDFRHNYKREYSAQTSSNNNITTDYNSEATDIVKSYYYSYKAGADIYVSPKHQLGFVVSGTIDDWSRNVNGPTILSDSSGRKTATVLNRTIAIEPYYNNTYNINYQFKPDTTGKILTADANYISFRNNSDGYIGNQSFDNFGDSTQPYQKLLYHQPSNIDIRSVKADMEYPVFSYKLKAGLKYSSVTINNNFHYDSLVDNELKFAESLSDHFIYTENIAAAYTSLSRQWKRTGIEIGLRAEHTSSDGNSINTGIDTKRNYTNLFPNLSVDQQLDKYNRLSIAVSRRINRPGYASLNPVRYFIDKFDYYQGNPYLKPEQSWLVSLSYSWLDKYIATVSYNRTNNFMSQIARIDSSGVLIQNLANYSYSGLYDMTLIVPVRMYSFWNISTVTDIGYLYYPILRLTGAQTASKLYVDAAVNQTFSIPKLGTIELMAHYTSPELYGIYITKHFLSVDGGVKAAIMKKKMDVKCAFTDIFHTSRYWGNSFVNTVQYNYTTIRDSRRLRISLTYHLGGKLSGGKSHSIDEEKRL